MKGLRTLWVVGMLLLCAAVARADYVLIDNFENPSAGIQLTGSGEGNYTGVIGGYRAHVVSLSGSGSEVWINDQDPALRQNKLYVSPGTTAFPLDVELTYDGQASGALNNSAFLGSGFDRIRISLTDASTSLTFTTFSVTVDGVTVNKAGTYETGQDIDFRYNEFTGEDFTDVDSIVLHFVQSNGGSWGVNVVGTATPEPVSIILGALTLIGGCVVRKRTKKD